jgi:lipid-binding SYLF domain-containing protein
LDTTKLAEPILAFVFGQRGLMAGLTLEGTKFTKLDLQ